MKTKIYADLSTLSEDSQIAVIGYYVTDHRGRTCFVLETKEKAQRYIDKLAELFPIVKIMSQGPTDDGGWSVVVGPR